MDTNRTEINNDSTILKGAGTIGDVVKQSSTIKPVDNITQTKSLDIRNDGIPYSYPTSERDTISLSDLVNDKEEEKYNKPYDEDEDDTRLKEEITTEAANPINIKSKEDLGIKDSVTKELTETITPQAVEAEKIVNFDNAPKKEEYNIPTNLDELEFPDDEEEDDDNNTTTESDEDRDSEIINNKLKEAVKSKIKPVAGKYNLSAFTISKKPVALNAVMEKVENPNLRAADWIAYNTGNKFRMVGFTGAEIDKMINPGGNRMQSESVRYKMLYDHIIDADKPATMEQWAKATSFFDIEHYWFGGFRATFEGTAYMPITNCPTDNKHVFLTDNLDIMQFVKFENDDAKLRFNDIYTGKIANNKRIYNADIVPVSEDFAVAFREPSIFNMVFEIAMLDQEFLNKYRDIIALVSYIDDIYYIDKSTMELRPIEYRVYPNNTAKTAKSKIIQFAKAIRKLSSDQYHAILMYIQEITNTGNHISYQIPEVTCIECGATIPAMPISADELVFTRHRLAALAVL